MDKLYNEGYISGRNEIDILRNFEHTYLINVAIYLALRKYNKKTSDNLSIIPEYGSSRGRERCDFVLKNIDGKIELVIEHENSWGNILYNYKKLVKRRWEKNRLLICYVYRKKDVVGEINKLKDYKKEHNIKKDVNILIAQKSDADFFNESNDYKEYII